MSDSLDSFVRKALGEFEGSELSAAIDSEGEDPCPDGHSGMALVAKGGMGSIFRSVQQSLEREVAVKVMASRRKSPEMADRFRREALILGMLEHPNIVPIHDLGMDGSGRLFYTMRLVRGRTLAAILRDLRAHSDPEIPEYRLPALVTVFRKICDALAFAHSRGVLHRDLKPENIMLGPFGEVLVMDWGLAKMIASTDPEADPALLSQSVGADFASEATTPIQTLVGSVMGTPQFMSPEQAGGRVGEIDERSDIFSLGSILYNILMLRPPIEAATAREALEKVREGRIVPLTTLLSAGRKSPLLAVVDAVEGRDIGRLSHLPGGRVPPALAAVAMKALAVDPEGRYQTVAELIADLEAYQGGYATKAEDAGALTLLLLFMRRHRATTAAAVMLMVAIIAFLLKLIASENRALISEQSAIQEKESTRRALAQAQVALADAALRESNGLAARAALDTVPADLRDSEWSYLLGRSDTSLTTLRTHTSGAIISASPHPVLPGVFAVLAADGSAALVNARTGEITLAFDTGFRPGSDPVTISVSPEGREIAVAGGGRGSCGIFNAADGRRLREWKWGRLMDAKFSPTRPEILVAGVDDPGRRIVSSHDAVTGAELWSIPCPSDWVQTAFLPSGDSFVVAYGESTVELRRTLDGGLIRALPDSRLYVHCLAVSPDSTMAAYGDEQSHVRCVRIEDGTALLDFRADTSTTRQILFTPDSRRLLTLTYLDKRASNHLRIWDVENGFLLQSLTTVQTTPRSMAIHERTGELVITGEVTKSWAIQPTNPLWTASCSVNGPWSGFAGPLDDLLCFAPGGEAQLLRLSEGGGVTRAWRHTDGTQYPVASISGDQRTLVHGDQRSGTLLVNRYEGSNPRPIAQWSLGSRLAFMRLNEDGSLVWTGDRIVETATGAGRPNFRPAFKGRLIDGHWLSGNRLVGSVSDDGRWSLVVFDAGTGSVVASAPTESRILDIAVSPDHRWVAEAGAGKKVRLRDPASLTVGREFRVHDAGVTALAFHPQRPILATASDDLTIRCWDWEKHTMVAQIEGLPIAPMALAWSSTGERLAAATVDRTARIWVPDLSGKSLNRH